MKRELKISVAFLMIFVCSCTKISENGIGGSPNGSCWCTDGVAHQLKIIHYPDAWKWDEQILKPAGDFIKFNTPSNNDVAVFFKNYHCSDKGHVTFVKNIIRVTDGFNVTFWGTNQTADETRWNTECECNNFSEWTFKVSDDDIANDKIKFYRNVSISYKCRNPFSSTVPSFSIGQKYSGGIIFYIDGTGQHGLIASSTDLSVSSTWWNGALLNTQARSISDGAANTTVIINLQGNTGNYAAKICRDLTDGGYTDWYLPSKEQLQKLLLQGVILGTSSHGAYWSSTEASKETAWCQYVVGSIQTDEGKSYDNKIRAIRNF